MLYKAASPDEEALCYGARQNGFGFTGRDASILKATILGEKREYELLCEMEFSSDRRRMSVIIRLSDGSIMLLCKGADSVMIERLAETPSNRSLLASTSVHLDTFSQQGLRTLILGYRELSEEEWLQWRAEWVTASNLIENREVAVRFAPNIVTIIRPVFSHLISI